jgi:hypothetical protein
VVPDLFGHRLLSGRGFWIILWSPC